MVSPRLATPAPGESDNCALRMFRQPLTANALRPRRPPPTHAAMPHAAGATAPLPLIRDPLGTRFPVPWVELSKLQLARRPRTLTTAVDTKSSRNQMSSSVDGIFEATVDAPTPRPVSMLQNMNACNAVNIETGQGVTVASKFPPTVYRNGPAIKSDCG